MDEPSFTELHKVVRLTFAGHTGLAGNFFLPCSHEIVSSLKKQGFSEEYEEMMIPSVLISSGRDEGFQATWGLPVFHTVTCFIGSGIAGWVVKKLCDTAYEKVILPAVRSMGSKHAKETSSGLNLEIRLFFETDQLMLRVATRCSSERDDQQVEKLVPIALQNAAEFIGRNGATGRMYTYNIINGQMSNVPTISKEMLSPGHLWTD
jgi:hypothetical protein